MMTKIFKILFVAFAINIGCRKIVASEKKVVHTVFQDKKNTNAAQIAFLHENLEKGKDKVEKVQHIVKKTAASQNNKIYLIAAVLALTVAFIVYMSIEIKNKEETFKKIMKTSVSTINKAKNKAKKGVWILIICIIISFILLFLFFRKRKR